MPGAAGLSHRLLGNSFSLGSAEDMYSTQPGSGGTPDPFEWSGGRTYILIQLVQLVSQVPGLGLGPVDVVGLLLLLPPQAEQLLPLLQLLSLQGLQLLGDSRQPACFHLQQAPTTVSCMAAIMSSFSGSVPWPRAACKCLTCAAF